MNFRIEGSGGLTIEVYEGSTGVTGGASATPINSNRNSTNTANLRTLKDPTIGVDGSLIDSMSVGERVVAGLVSSETEIILNCDVNYLYRITSLGTSNIISYRGFWHEYS